MRRVANRLRMFVQFSLFSINLIDIKYEILTIDELKLFQRSALMLSWHLCG